MTIQKIVCYKGHESAFEMGKPIGRELSKKKLDQVDEGRLKITKGE